MTSSQSTVHRKSPEFRCNRLGMCYPLVFEQLERREGLKLSTVLAGFQIYDGSYRGESTIRKNSV